MLKKLRLDQTKTYEQTIATYEIAKMLVNFIKGREHYLSVGAEQGDVETWDDLVIEDNINHQVHIQVKRQNTDFSTNECIRDEINRQNGVIELRDLSTIDKSMKELADWLNDPDNDTTTKEFYIELPISEVKLKKNLSVRSFKELIQTQFKPGITTIQGLESLAERDKNIQRIFEWLTTWCGFNDWEHILRLLAIIKIKDSGAEIDIESRTEDILREVFNSNKLVEVRLLIKSYTIENTTFTGTIKPRSLLKILKKYLQPNIGFWTQYDKQGAKWFISGINDLETNNEIERSSLVVPKLWNGNTLQNLKINAITDVKCNVTDSLLRMVIHQSGNSNAHCENSAIIKKMIEHRVGGTLGISQNDLQAISIVENSEVYVCSDSRKLANRSQIDDCSSELNKTMDSETWDRVVALLENKISTMENLLSNTLCENIENRWEAWKALLALNYDEIRRLLNSMLHPTAEGEDIKGAYRVGPKTAQNLAESLFLLLIISTSLDPNNEGDWNTILDKYILVSIGLEYWSGEAGKERKVRKIDEDGYVITGKESANVIVFSKITASSNEIKEDLISSPNKQVTDSIADGKTPYLLITNSIKLRKKIIEGDFSDVQIYIKSKLRDTDTINHLNIKEVIG